MKKIIAFLVCVTLVFALASPSYAAEVSSYTFDDAKSITTVTSNLSIGGKAVFEDGFEGKGLSLNGSYGMYLGEVGSEFSVSALVKLTSAGGTDTLFFKDMDNKGDKWTGVISQSGKSAVWTHGSNNRWKTVITDSTSLGNWTHICYTEKNGTATLFVNGTAAGTANVETGNGKLYLGATYWSADAPKGIVDNVSFYNNALSGNEVSEEFGRYVKNMISVPKKAVMDIELPSKIGSKEIVWESNNPAISNSGKVVRQDEDVRVTLTAKMDGAAVGEFEVLVLKKPKKADDEIILSYKFDENDSDIIYDKSGNGNHGASFGNLLVDSEGAHFDGVDDYVKMPKGIINNCDTITIVMKMKPDKSKTHMFAYGFGNGPDTGYIFLNTSRPGTNEIWFAGTKTNYSQERSISSVPGIRTNEWATVGIAINEKNVEMYVDGELVMDGYLGVTASDLGECDKNYIAKSLYEGDAYFGGVVEEFTIYGYTMSREDMAVYKKDVEYAPLKEKEEYITNVNFADKIEIEVDTFGRNDVKIAGIVIDETGEITEFSVINPDEELNLNKEGTICVFAFNEKDNIPGDVYVKGQGDGFTYEYHPGEITVLSENSYENGMVIVAGFDISGTLTGVQVRVREVNKGEEFTLSGDFENAVTFKMLYWSDLVSMTPEK